uniref:Coiled-coil domain-containing protein 150 isoform X4 n=1 Tax=Geotrypetes seraphini TaxID=260995 RepID=A0A6P8SB76_GEOSA|nr:coiled-coil domain-containing protein 150 isoform X4 [Geotrypetes seraphini]
MARPVISPMNVHATAPETFSILQQRIRVAEEQAVSLIQDLEKLGVSRQSFQPSASEVPHPISPYQVRSAFVPESDMLWKNCESLVSQVCHMESVIQTLKLNIFRLHTEKELNPKQSAQLEKHLNMLQEEHAQELKEMQLEMMQLRQKLHEKSEEKEMVQDEKERLSAALEIATATKSDVTIAADLLRSTKNQISLRLQEVEEQLSQERSFRLSLEESQAAQLLSIQDMEKVVELERKEVQVLQQDCQSLRDEGQIFRHRLQTEEEKNRQLEEECKQLKSNLDAQDATICRLQEEEKNTLSSLNKENEDNMQLRFELASLREIAERLQALNEQLNNQCVELGASLQKITLETAKLIIDHQTILKAEQEQMIQKLHEQDILLDAARANITAELQNAHSERLNLEKELKSLHTQHTDCKRKACLAEEKLVTQKELQESTIAELERNLEVAREEEEKLLRQKELLAEEVESLRRALDVSQEGNKKLALSLEQVLKNNSSIKSKLSKTQDQLDSKNILQQHLEACREQVAEEAKMEAKLFSQHLESLKKQFQLEQAGARKAVQKDLAELRNALNEATSKSAELSRANRELHQKVANLGKTVSNQQVKLKSQKKQIQQQQQDAKTSSGQNIERMKEIETELKQMELVKEEYQKKNYEQILEDKVRQLKKLKEAMEYKLKAASKESEQISVNLEEAHCLFKTKFDNLQQELMKNQKWNKCEKCGGGIRVEERMKAALREGTKDSINEKLMKLPSHSLLNHWETKQELKLISRTYLGDLDRK